MESVLNWVADSPYGQAVGFLCCFTVLAAVVVALYWRR